MGGIQVPLAERSAREGNSINPLFSTKRFSSDRFRQDRPFPGVDAIGHIWSRAAEIADGPHLGTENWRLNGHKGSITETAACD